MKTKNYVKQCFMQLIEKWIKAFFNGYASEINSFVPSMHWIAADPKELNDYKYDPEKAKNLR